MVTQQDSRAATRISESVQRDSAAMKTIAALTMMFLPATFVSVSSKLTTKMLYQRGNVVQAVFSTSFFNFSPGAQSISQSADGEWVISHKFWIYWAVSGPLTVFTVALWFLWHW